MSQWRRRWVAGSAMALAVLVWLPAEARAACSRAELQTAVDRYIVAQGRGDPAAMQLAAAARFSQNMQPVPAQQSVLRATVSEFDALVTDRDDWLFNAANYLRYAAAEDWGVIPEAARDKGAPDDNCLGGFPTGMVFADRRVIVDPAIGAVVVLAKFTANDLPDSHLFRVEKGRIRFVHMLTVCTVANCGFPALPTSGR